MCIINLGLTKNGLAIKSKRISVQFIFQKTKKNTSKN